LDHKLFLNIEVFIKILTNENDSIEFENLEVVYEAYED
jgi:hypothetical protein